MAEGAIAYDYGPPGKRNISSSLTSPRIIDKKLKLFVSPNRYGVLQVDDDSGGSVFFPSSDQKYDLETQSLTDITKNSPQYQPIYINNVTNFTIFKDKLIQLTGNNWLHLQGHVILSYRSPYWAT